MNETTLIYHYTSFDVFKSIFENVDETNKTLSFLASNCAFMNDPTEIKEGIHFTIEMLNDFGGARWKRMNEVIGVTVDRVYDTMLRMSTKVASGVPYAISFSKNKDNINMWKMYGDSGRGISLGFNKDMLQEIEGRLSGCIYKKGIELIDDETRRRFVDKIEEILDQTPTAQSEMGQARRNFIRFVDKISKLCSSIKNEAYKYEKELRLVKFEKKALFRVVNGHLIPYTQINIPIESLESIVLGPDCDPRNEQAIKLFLRSYGQVELLRKIEKSKVPYRN